MAYSFSNIDNKINNIRENTRNGVDHIEDYAQRHAKIDLEDEYEEALLSKTNDLEQSVHNDVDSIRQLVFSRRPTQTDPNYLRKKQQYVEYVQHATTGMSSLKGGIRALFSKIVDVVKRVARWVREHIGGFFNFISAAFSVIAPILNGFGIDIPYS